MFLGCASTKFVLQEISARVRGGRKVALRSPHTIQGIPGHTGLIFDEDSNKFSAKASDVASFSTCRESLACRSFSPGGPEGVVWPREGVHFFYLPKRSHFVQIAGVRHTTDADNSQRRYRPSSLQSAPRNIVGWHRWSVMRLCRRVRERTRLRPSRDVYWKPPKVVGFLKQRDPMRRDCSRLTACLRKCYF
jgi:hypothetical protein